MPITVIDIVLLILALIICIRAGINGLINEVFGLGTFILGAWLAFMFMNKLQPYLAECMNDKLASVLTFLILFTCVFLIMKIIQTVLKSFFSAQILNSLDHGLGLIIGVAEGVLFIIIVFILMEILQSWIDTSEIRNGSYLYHLFQGMIDSAGFKLPETIHV